MDTGYKIFEGRLWDHIRYNVENAILPTETAVCRMLLDRQAELVEACDELWRRLEQRDFFLAVFLKGLLGAASEWSPERMVTAHQGRDRLDEVNERISAAAFELADLLRVRSNLYDHSEFASETHYYVVDVINEAARDNHRFNSYVKERLKETRGQFDLKYWPCLPQFVRELAVDAGQARSVALTP